MENFYFQLSYSLNENEQKTYKLGSSEQDFKLLNFNKSNALSNWIVHEFILEVSEATRLNGLRLFNESNNNLKLGFLSLGPPQNETIDTVESLKIKNKSCIRLDNRHYYFVEIEWDFDSKNDIFGYFNVFLKSSKQLDAFKYVGSTTIKCFRLGLELENVYFNYNYESDYNREEDKIIKLLVQFVNEDFKFKNILNETSTIEVELPGQANIKKIIYDFESIF